MTSNTSAQPLLTRAECNVLRGVAIIGIFLHNFCHWLSPIVKENEYTFVRHNVDVLNQVLSHPDIYLPVHLLSFFGHYGVPVFLFLSAYGLVKKYEAPAIPGDGSRVLFRSLKPLSTSVQSLHITPSTPYASATVPGWDRLAQDVWEQKGRRGLFLSGLSSTL